MWGKRRMYDQFIDAQGFQNCTETSSKNIFKEKDYPTTGLNFNLWKQSKVKGDTTCSGGLYKEMADTCYNYSIMK